MSLSGLDLLTMNTRASHATGTNSKLAGSDSSFFLQEAAKSSLAPQMGEPADAAASSYEKMDAGLAFVFLGQGVEVSGIAHRAAAHYELLRRSRGRGNAQARRC